MLKWVCVCVRVLELNTPHFLDRVSRANTNRSTGFRGSPFRDPLATLISLRQVSCRSGTGSSAPAPVVSAK